MTEHTHSWRMVLHLDGCHDWQTAYACGCGATRQLWAERQMRTGYGTVWALDDCERCQALLRGARRRPRRDRTQEPVPS